MHVDFVLRHLPETKSFVDVFGGSAVILLNKKRVPIETYNDVNSDIVNFFRVLRDRRKGLALIKQIYLTPYSETEYLDCIKNLREGDDIERARRLFVALNQSFNGTFSRQTGWKISTNVCKTKTSEAISRYVSKIPNLEMVIERMRLVQISNSHFRKIFRKFDNKDVLLYCDPPYVHGVRCNNNEYKNEMSDADHEEFLALAKKSNSLIAISGYESKLYNENLKDWYKVKARDKKNTLFHSTRAEVLWMNYNPDEFIKPLFSEVA